MPTALEAMQEQVQANNDERGLHRKMQWFVEKWTTSMDLNKRNAAELSADLAIVVQAVHRDASRHTHELLAKSLAAMPSPVFVTKPETK